MQGMCHLVTQGSPHSAKLVVFKCGHVLMTLFLSIVCNEEDSGPAAHSGSAALGWRPSRARKAAQPH